MPAAPARSISSRQVTAVAIIALLAAVILFGQNSDSTQWAIVMANSAHGPVSALIAAVVFQLLTLSTSMTLTRRWAIAIVATTLLGILIEIIQGFIGRDAEVIDACNDLLGALLGAGLAVLAVGAAKDRRLRVVSSALAFIAGVLIAVPVVHMAAAYIARDMRFPVLMDANRPLGDFFVTSFWLHATREILPADANPIEPGERGLWERDAERLAWSVAVTEVPADWRRWNTLVVELFNPAPVGKPMQLRIFDDRSDGLATRDGYIDLITLPPRRRIRWTVSLHDIATAPADRRIDLSRVRGLLLTSSADERSPDLYVLNMRLE